MIMWCEAAAACHILTQKTCLASDLEISMRARPRGDSRSARGEDRWIGSEAQDE
jgi:hypothetical protein